MAKPSRNTFNPKSTGAGVTWNCTKCGATGASTSRAKAGSQFDDHDCTD